MEKYFIIELLQNIAIMVSFVILYDYFWLKFEKQTWLNKIYAGLAISLIAIVIMFTPFHYTSTIIFDVRSVLLSVTGLFFGLIPTVLTAIAALIVRISQGGDGMYMGMAVILTSSSIGLLWRYLRPHWQQKKYGLELLCMGLSVHIIMAACVFFLPHGKELEILKLISIPLIFIYTPSTILLGVLMVRQQRNWQNRNAKEKLIETEYLLQQVVQSSHIYFIVTDTNYNIVNANKYFLKNTEFSEDEIIQKNIISFLFHPSKDLKTNDFIVRLQQQNFTSEEIESEFITKKNDTRVALWFISKTYNYFMVATGFVLIGVDTTERKLHEQKLLEMNQELEAQYEIFKELNLKLNDANKIAEESSRLKSLLLSNLSHEVRTPMNAIIGFSDLMQKETNEEKKLQFSGIISKSAKQLLQTIDDIVFVSKLQSKKQTLNITNVYLLGIINECVLMRQFEKQKQDTPLNIVYDKTNENFTFKTDENKLKQILTNLISNAFNYTQQGKIDVGFYTEENHIILFVKDTGIGIPFEEKDRVYDIFFRGESSNALAIRGLGLGLSIVKELVNVLQGTVWFESEVNKGTTFFVKLPVKHY